MDRYLIMSFKTKHENWEEELSDFSFTDLSSFEIKLLKKNTVSTRQSRRVWTSFGIFMILLPFMDRFEALLLQATNNFCYRIAISRVHYMVRVNNKIYFTQSKVHKYKRIVYSMDKFSHEIRRIP